MTEGEPAKKKFQLRIPVVSDLGDALKNTSDIKGAFEAMIGGAEIAALLYALSLPNGEERAALGGLIGMSSLAILGYLRERGRK